MTQTEIALFCRNEAQGLAEAVSHLCKQLETLNDIHLPITLHLLENGSEDQTPRIAEQLAQTLKGPFEIQAHLHLPPGKSRTWNYFLSIATAPHLIFLDADIQLEDHCLELLLRELSQKPQLALVGAIPTLAPNFQPETFWQSVFALPYSAIAPAPSLAGGAYVAQRYLLEPMPDDVINEDLYLSLKHEEQLELHEQATFYVAPPKKLQAFIAQRTRILRSDHKEHMRVPHQNLKTHRRSGFKHLAPFYQKGGLARTVAFLMARTYATALARVTPRPKDKDGWTPAPRNH